MPNVADHLVGRAAELSTVDRAVADVERGAPVPLLLAGEPGIGKTRLLAELAARADARGCLVLTGSASELERDLPFWVFVDALDEYVAGIDPRHLTALGDDVGAGLAQVLPALADLASGGGAAVPDQRYRAHRAVRALLERLAAGQPLVVVLDDVHWADAASVDLLAALLRQPPGGAVLLAMGVRPRQMPDRLAVGLERAHRRRALTRIELRGLERHEAGELLGDGVDAAHADALFAESGGNPFYLEQLARSPGRTGAAEAATTLGGVDVPRAVVASLAEELSLLSAPTRRMLEGAAVAGDPFEVELSAAAAAVDEAASMSALDDLLALELVRTTDVPRRFRFRHPLVRRAVYESVPGGWLLGAHERCAEALARRGASAVARAHHIEHAARHGDAAAIAVLADAAAATSARAPASAARWLGAALRLLPEGAPGEQRVGLLTTRASALAATGQLAAARADLLESIDLLPEPAAALRVRLTAACAGTEHLLGEHEQARARLAGALDDLPDPSAPEAAELMIELAIGRLLDADYAAMCVWATRALDRSQARGDGPLTAAAAGLLAMAEACAGEIADAQRHRAQASEIVDSLSDDQLAARLAASGYLANAELYLDRHAEAAEHAGRGLGVARATGQISPTLVPTLVTAWAMTGRLADAVGLLDDALESARISGIPQALAWTLVNRSQTALAAGEFDAALSCAEEAVELTRQFDERFMGAWSGAALAAALLATGEAARAADVLVDHAGGEELPAIPAGWRGFGLEILTSCRLALGQRDGARRSLALAESTAETVGLPMAAAWAHRAAAAVALNAGDPAAAGERALASAAMAEQAGAVLEAAQSRVLAGRSLAQAGDADAAATELERAAAAFEACGALRRRDAAEQELRRLGRTVHRRTRPGTAGGTSLESLTERERQVAALVVDRRTNPEIAAELFLSLKTVESHLRNIFRKFGVASRVELARAVERAERSR